MSPWTWTFWRFGWTHRRDTATSIGDSWWWDRVWLGLYWRRDGKGDDRG